MITKEELFGRTGACQANALVKKHLPALRSIASGEPDPARREWMLDVLTLIGLLAGAVEDNASSVYAATYDGGGR